MASALLHPFERAGLGRAPFRVVGCEELRGPLPVIGPDGMPTGASVGAPGQPMGCCDYCFTGIALCFLVRAADGRIFKVGSDCVRRVVQESQDSALSASLARELRLSRHKKDDARCSAALEALRSDQRLEPLLAARVMRVIGDWKQSAWDVVSWNLIQGRAGRAGKVRAARLVEQAMLEVK